MNPLKAEAVRGHEERGASRVRGGRRWHRRDRRDQDHRV